MKVPSGFRKLTVYPSPRSGERRWRRWIEDGQWAERVIHRDWKDSDVKPRGVATRKRRGEAGQLDKPGASFGTPEDSACFGINKLLITIDSLRVRIPLSPPE